MYIFKGTCLSKKKIVRYYTKKFLVEVLLKISDENLT